MDPLVQLFVRGMQDKELYEGILGLEPPWRVVNVILDTSGREDRVKIENEQKRLPCPTYAGECKRHEFVASALAAPGYLTVPDPPGGGGSSGEVPAAQSQAGAGPVGGSRFAARHNKSCRYLLLILLAVLVLGCDRMLEGGAMIAIEIKERNEEARKARVDLKPRPYSKRSELENKALAILNSDISGERPKAKEIFCGNPPDLSSLPPIYFKLKLSAYVSEDAPKECLVAINEKWPGLESCYLVFENGSTGYVNCYSGKESGEITCEPSKQFLVKLLWHSKELEGKCGEIGEAQ